MFDFNKIESLNSALKSCLEDDFGLLYLSARVIDKEINNEEDKDNIYLPLFNIPKQRESIFKKISSIDRLEETKISIKNFYEIFISDFNSYFERVENQLDSKNQESFEIIEKIIKNRKKKLFSKIDKFEIENHWKIKTIQDEFLSHLQSSFEDIINSLLNPIEVGVKENSVYEGLITIFNKFLSSLGIYTQSFEVGYILQDNDWEFIQPELSESAKTSDMNKFNMIKSIITRTYMVNSKDIISAGKIILWEIRHNG